jgi:hypothetical protein
MDSGQVLKSLAPIALLLFVIIVVGRQLVKKL